MPDQKSSSIRELFLRNKRGLLSYLTRRVGPDDASDLLQETFVRALRHDEFAAVAESPMRIVLDHIPKTGGTTIMEAMAACIGERGELSASTVTHHSAIAAAGERRFLGAHFCFYPEERHAPGWFYCTVLREPVDRVLSQYFYYRQFRKQFESGAITDLGVAAALNSDLEQFVADPRSEVKQVCWNGQALHFASRVEADPMGLSEKLLLDAAICSLEDYDLVGVYGDLQSFFDACCSNLGLTTYQLPHLHSTVGRCGIADLPAATRERLYRSNCVDAALYQWAKSRFEAGLAGHASSQKRQGRAQSQLRVRSSGNQRIEIADAKLFLDGAPTTCFAPGDWITLELILSAYLTESDLTIGLAICDEAGQIINGTNSRILNQIIGIHQAGCYRSKLQFRAALPVGQYSITVALHKGLSHMGGCFHWCNGLVHFKIAGELSNETDLAFSISSLERL